MNKPVLVVMAAGMGSRYGGMKQIDPVGPNGQVIVDYSLYDARRAGFETVIFVIKHEIEDAFKAAIGERVSKAMNVKYAFQQLDELPAGFAVLQTGHMDDGIGNQDPHQQHQAEIQQKALGNGFIHDKIPLS